MNPPEAADGGLRPTTVITIRCRLDGPLVVEPPENPPPGGVVIRVVDHLGQPVAVPGGKRLLALCRCGRTSTRPFCDGSHRDQGPPPTE